MQHIQLQGVDSGFKCTPHVPTHPPSVERCAATIILAGLATEVLAVGEKSEAA